MINPVSRAFNFPNSNVRFGKRTLVPTADEPTDYWMRKHRPEGAGRDYEVTNRGKELLAQHARYPHSWMDARNLKGKKIIDLCCGGGKFVTELRAEGVDIQGVDDYMDATLLKQKNAFVKADARDLPYDDESIDIIYSALGPFSFGSENQSVQLAMLDEINRVLKPGGKLRLGDVESDVIQYLLRQLPGNRLSVSIPTESDRDRYEPGYCEFTKN